MEAKPPAAFTIAAPAAISQRKIPFSLVESKKLIIANFDYQTEARGPSNFLI